MSQFQSQIDLCVQAFTRIKINDLNRKMYVQQTKMLYFIFFDIKKVSKKTLNFLKFFYLTFVFGFNEVLWRCKHIL